MLKSPVTVLTLSKDQSFDLESKMSPTFYNVGNTPVTIHGIVIEPDNFFRLDYPHVVLTGTVEIEFNKTDVVEPLTQVVIHYLSYKENKTQQVPANSNC